MELISPGRFLVKRRLSEVKLLLFDNFFVVVLEVLLTAVPGRLVGKEDFADLGGWLAPGETGERGPYRPEMEPLGVPRALLGKRAKCACGGEVADAAVLGAIGVGEAIDAPQMDEYAESFPVIGGL